MESAAQRHRGRRRGGARSQPPSARPAGHGGTRAQKATTGRPALGREDEVLDLPAGGRNPKNNWRSGTQGRPLSAKERGRRGRAHWPATQRQARGTRGHPGPKVTARRPAQGREDKVLNLPAGGRNPKELQAERDARSAAQRHRKRKAGQGTLASHPAPSPRDTGAPRPKGHRAAASPGQGRQGPQPASRGAQPQRTSTTVTLDGQGLSGPVPIHKESRRKPKVGVLKVGGRNS